MDAPPVAIVNQVFANVYFPGAWPIGQHFRVGGDKNGIDVQIVGVAKSARYDSLKNKIPPVTYLSYLQTAKKWRLQQMFFESRTAENPFSAGEYCQGNRASGKPARTGCRCTDTSPNDRRNDCAGANICCTLHFFCRSSTGDGLRRALCDNRLRRDPENKRDWDPNGVGSDEAADFVDGFQCSAGPWISRAGHRIWRPLGDYDLSQIVPKGFGGQRSGSVCECRIDSGRVHGYGGMGAGLASLGDRSDGGIAARINKEIPANLRMADDIGASRKVNTSPLR
jgi:hypothetical protein